jgi:hypothetical protein
LDEKYRRKSAGEGKAKDASAEAAAEARRAFEKLFS